MLNDFNITKYYSIKSISRVIVFSPTSNDDIQFHLAILFPGNTLKRDITHTKGSKLSIDYVRKKYDYSIVRSKNQIQKDFHELLELLEKMFITGTRAYLTLLQKLYLIIYMLYYCCISKFCYFESRFFNKILFCVDDWKRQRCCILLNKH